MQAEIAETNAMKVMDEADTSSPVRGARSKAKAIKGTADARRINANGVLQVQTEEASGSGSRDLPKGVFPVNFNVNVDVDVRSDGGKSSDAKSITSDPKRPIAASVMRMLEVGHQHGMVWIATRQGGDSTLQGVESCCVPWRST